MVTLKALEFKTSGRMQTVVKCKVCKKS